MTQTLETFVQPVRIDGDSPTRYGLGGQEIQQAERPIDRFVAELRQMTREERIRASRYSFKPWKRWAWARLYPNEVPLINNEFEWIALASADLD